MQTLLDPAPITLDQVMAEGGKCRRSLAYFCDTYGRVKEGIGHIRPFKLWPSQVPVCELIDKHRFVVSLKARQLGLTWIASHDALRVMCLYPGASVGAFSLREEEAQKIIERVKLVYKLLPMFFLPARAGEEGFGIDKDNSSYLRLSNGSSIQAFSTTSGDSYTFSLVIVDEADLIPDLTELLGRVRPTIDVGGRIHLISRSNKQLPNSTFKKIYRSAAAGRSKWKAIFLPWSAHPLRTQAWYENECREAMATHGYLDTVYEQYPETPAQALAASSADKRIPAAWVDAVYSERPPTGTPEALASIPSLRVYTGWLPNTRYFVGVDPAEGNPTSDDSAASMIDDKGDEIACLYGKLQPRVLGEYVAKLAKAYGAEVLVERNNHGHAVLIVLQDLGVKVMSGEDGRPGWVQNNRSKAQLLSDCADAVRTKDCQIHTLEVATQLSGIDGSLLAAPPGEHDDLAMAHALAIEARVLASRFGLRYSVRQEPPTHREQPTEEKYSPVNAQDSGRGYLGIG